MRVVGIDELEACLQALPPGPEGQLLAWLDETRAARWRGADEIRDAFPRAIIDLPTVVFLIAEDSIAIRTLVFFQTPVLLITEVTSVSVATAGTRRLS
jgi:mRNA-degrading endonuclease HigB of HigAB toxin-antitoxin module